MQNIKAILIISIVLFPVKLFAGNDRLELSAALIPDELKKNANAVVRYYYEDINVSGENFFTIKEETAITILGKGGESHSVLIGFYNNWITLQTMDIYVYNKSGKLIKKVKPKDIIDQSYIPSGILYDDNRIKVYKPLSNEYPYTIVCNQVNKITNFFSFPDWSPQSGSDVSVEKAYLKIRIPGDYKIYAETFHLPEPEIKEENGSIEYYWEANNIKAFREEQFSPPDFDLTPTVMVKPEEFVLDGYAGNTNSWKEYGKFQYDMIKGLDEISPEGSAEIRELIKDAKTDREKIEILYKFMQKKTRYVCVSIGIGGLKPYPASYVEKYGYGDCKGLSNYMKGILNVAGIKSYYTNVEAGSNPQPLILDFPSPQFNHIILCVPLEKDTMWLECTSQIMPCGFLGDFTDNRNVLLITEEGGKIARTPEYTSRDNYQNTVAEISFDKNFVATCDVFIRLGCLQYDNLFYLMHVDLDKQKKQLYKLIDIKEFIIKDYSFKEIPDVHPEMDIELSLDLNRYISKTGDRIFLPLNLMNRTKFVPDKLEERKNDIYLRQSYMDTDTIIYHIPENYHVSFLPEPTTISSEFGVYNAHCEIDGNKIIYIRQMERLNGIFPETSYQDLFDFYKNINKADNAKALLIRSSSSAE